MSRAKFDTPQISTKWIKYAFMAFVLFILFIILTSTTFITIPPGKKGVEFKKFGGGLVKDKIYDQGFHVIMPWNLSLIHI